MFNVYMTRKHLAPEQGTACTGILKRTSCLKTLPVWLFLPALVLRAEVTKRAADSAAFTPVLPSPLSRGTLKADGKIRLRCENTSQTDAHKKRV